eukprot:TRINITY_DN6419_c0_g1_i1.p1 TRINITY_DN6419_c0_g1~~TRINITY_DN6419_c0_g1_i1.p1  ORF type:complete len:951 (+),score=205.05 TRINITY_DN6419_c0_g1_i1:189-3041(+)
MTSAFSPLANDLRKLSGLSMFGSSQQEQKRTLTISIDPSNIEIQEPLTQMVLDKKVEIKDCYTCSVGGFRCCVKMFVSQQANVDVASFLKDLSLLEELPKHPNVVPYLFHDRDKSGTLRLFTAYYSQTLHGLLQSKKREYDGLKIESDSDSDWSDESESDEDDDDWGNDDGDRSGKKDKEVKKKQNNSSFKGKTDTGKLVLGETVGFTVDEIRSFVQDMVQGVEFLHAQKIIHRDMNPKNVFVVNGKNGPNRLCIGNLDAAKKMTTRRGRAQTFLGSPAYVAPEVLKTSSSGTASYTFDADIWSVGMIIYELVTLEKPYSYGAAVSTNDIMFRGTRPELPPNISPKLKPMLDIYNACTAYDQAQRPRIEVLVEALVTGGDINTLIARSAGISTERLAKEQEGFTGIQSKSHLFTRVSEFDIGGTTRANRAGQKIFERFVVVGVPPNVDENDAFPAVKTLYTYPATDSANEGESEVCSFCFPAGHAKMLRSRRSSVSDLNEFLFSNLDRLEKPEHSFSFLMRELDSNQQERILFGMCIVNYELTHVLPSFAMGDDDDARVVPDSSHVSPRAYVLLTRFPFFQLQYDVLSSVIARERLNNMTMMGLQPGDKIPRKDDDSENESLTIVSEFYTHHVPEQGQSLSFKLPGELRSLEFQCPPGNQDTLIAEWCLPSLFATLSVENVKAMFTACLLERSVVVSCSNLGILSAAIMAMIPLLYPYVWQSVLLPILPERLYDLLEAPVPFIVGVTSLSGESIVDKDMSDVVIVDLERNVVSVPANSPLPALPNEHILMRHISLYTQSMRESKESYTSYANGARRIRTEYQRAMGSIISEFHEFHRTVNEQINSFIKNDNPSDVDFCESEQLDQVMAQVDMSDKSLRPFFGQFFATQQFNVHAPDLMLQLMAERKSRRSASTPLAQNSAMGRSRNSTLAPGSGRQRFITAVPPRPTFLK